MIGLVPYSQRTVKFGFSVAVSCLCLLVLRPYTLSLPYLSVARCV